MKLHIKSWQLFLILIFILRYSSPSLAFLSDKKEGKWRLIGKLKSEATFRTIDTPDNNPIPFEAGDLVSQRNLLFVEFRHDIGEVRPWLEAGYFLQGRFYYDSAWDLGPDVLKYDPTREYYLINNRDDIDEVKWDADLFMGYLDLTGGPVFLRVGRQILAWGEMSTLRVLDGTNPMDNSSLAVDLLERLIPLFMVRTTISKDNVGPFSELSLEGYYNPGKVDNTNGEDIIDGSPIIPPIGRYTLEDIRDYSDPLNLGKLMQNITQVEDDYDEDRFGFKIGTLIGELELNFAYFRAYSDIPVPLIDMESFQPIFLQWGDFSSFSLCDPIKWILQGQKLNVLKKIDKVDVYGSSFNYYIRAIETVIRGELALYKNVPKMTPGSVRDMIAGMGSQVYPPPPFQTIALDTILSIVPLGDLETMVLPFSSGQISRFDVWKYGLGFDKFMTVPYLNREEFVFLLEYVGSKTVDYQSKAIVKPWKSPRGDPIYETEFSNTFVFIATTNYLNGNLVPRLVVMYEMEPKAVSFIPSVRYEWRSAEFEVNYFHTISDTYEGNLGMLETRNELSFRATLNF